MTNQKEPLLRPLPLRDLLGPWDGNRAHLRLLPYPAVRTARLVRIASYLMPRPLTCALALSKK